MTTLELILRFLQVVIPLLLKYHGTVSSWLRTPARNATVGGAEDSRHLHGTAIDCEFEEQVAKEAFTADCLTAGLRVREEGDHLHIDDRSWA